jgi:site-specific recombinase XerD
LDRHGNVRLYYRRRVGELKIRLSAQPGTAEFAAEYEAAQARADARASDSRRVPQPPEKGTLGWLCGSYLRSAEFSRLAGSTQRTRQRLLASCLAESVAPDKAETFAQFPLSRLTSKALRVLRDRKGHVPAGANDRLKAIRALFAWAVDHDLVETNPSAEVRRVKHPSTGYHTWSSSEVLQFEARHTIGTKARLAFALLLWTGVRRSDVVVLGRQHVKEGWFKIPLQKNRNRTPVIVELPIAPELARIIDASPVGDLTFLVTDYGKPFSAAGFGGWFRDRCNEAGLPRCSAHGLRKAGAVRAAENGATAHELMAVFGWLSLAEAQRYTRAADRRTLAKNATRLMARKEETGENK